jgi:hypothetical protein
MGFEIEIEFFFFRWALMDLKICTMQTNNLDKLTFISKNQPIDPKVDCFSPSNFIKLIKTTNAYFLKRARRI